MGVKDALRSFCFCCGIQRNEAPVALVAVADTQEPLGAALCQPEPSEELLRLQQDLSAIGNSTWFQRVSLLLEAVSFHACSSASIFGIVEGPGREFILLASSAKFEGHIPIGTVPSAAQALVLSQMLSTKRPVSESIQGPRAKGATSATSASACAVPLFEGGAVAGALLLEPHPPDSTATTSAPCRSLSTADESRVEPDRAARIPSERPAQSLPPRSPAVLQRLALAASVGLGADAARLRWMASVLHRVSTTNSMHALVWELCEDLYGYVRDTFIVHSHVRAALLPRSDAPVGLLFQAQPGNTYVGASGNANNANHGNNNAMSHGSYSYGSNTASLVQSLGRVRQSELHQLLWGSGGSGALRLARTSGDHFGVQAAAAQGGSNGMPATVVCSKLGATSLGGMVSRQRPAVAAASSLTGSDCSAASGRRKRAPSTPTACEPTQSARVLALAADASALSRPLDAVTSATLATGPSAIATGGGNGVSPVTSRTIVVQLPAHLSTDAATPSLHAQAFPLKHTVLQALAPAGPYDPPFRGTSIDDVASYLQSVHNPSRDVCVLMASPRTGTGTMSNNTGFAFPGSPRAAPVGPNTPTGSLHAGSGGSGGIGSAGMGSTGGGAAGGPPAALRSLVLVGAQLGGAVLAFYLCFPKRLPAELLEAVRESCSELLDKMLMGSLRSKLTGSLAPEFETLLSTTPGNFAVLRSPSLNGLLYRPTSHGGVVCKLPPRSAGPQRGGGGCCAGIPVRVHCGCGEGGGGGAAAAVMAVATPSGAPAAVPACTAHVDGGAGSARLCHGESMDLCCSSSGELSPFSAVNATPKGACIPRTVSCNVDCGGHAITAPVTATATVTATGTGMAGGLAMTSSFLRQRASRDCNQLGLGLGVNDELLSVMLQMRHSETACSQGEPLSASIMTVTGLDPAVCMRQQLDLLVTSIHTTMTTEGNGTVASCLDDLEQLELTDVLGKGGGGVVYRGRMGTQEVAVKVMELPDADQGEALHGFSNSISTPRAPEGCGARPATPGPDADGPAGQLPRPLAGTALAKEQLRARRALLRNAMEMAVQGRVSHPNLIQVYGTYTNVVVERRRRPDGSLCHCLAPSEGPAQDCGLSSPSPVCCAIVAELADGGSLATTLATRTFPRVIIAPPGARSAHQDLQPFHIDMKGIYMTLLDVALALRHLHSLNLVHRDVKPANLLLKSNPRDYRGFTVKLADFGFVLHLSEVDEDGTRYAMVDQACGTVTHMAPELLPGKARVEAGVDVYSFGILMWECVAGGVRPFPHLHPDLIPRHVYKGARPIFAESIPLSYRALAQACWSTDPQRRPRASDLVAHITGQLSEYG